MFNLAKLFKPSKTHQLPYQFFFGSESCFHAETGTIMVKNGEVVRFSVVGLAPEAPLDLILLSAIFEEAEYVGLRPVALQSFRNNLDGYDYQFVEAQPKLTFVAKHLTNDPHSPELVHVLVRTNEDGFKQLYFHSLRVEEFLDEATTPNVTPESMATIFDHVQKQGFLPIAWIGTGFIATGQTEVFETPMVENDHIPAFLRARTHIEPMIGNSGVIESESKENKIDPMSDLPAVIRNPRAKKALEEVA